jgi:hypothetical protein
MTGPFSRRPFPVMPCLRSGCPGPQTVHEDRGLASEKAQLWPILGSGQQASGQQASGRQRWATVGVRPRRSGPHMVGASWFVPAGRRTARGPRDGRMSMKVSSLPRAARAAPGGPGWRGQTHSYCGTMPGRRKMVWIWLSVTEAFSAQSLVCPKCPRIQCRHSRHNGHSAPRFRASALPRLRASAPPRGNDGAGGGPVLGNSEPGYSWQTYPECLQAAGVDGAGSRAHRLRLVQRHGDQFRVPAPAGRSRRDRPAQHYRPRPGRVTRSAPLPSRGWGSGALAGRIRNCVPRRR